MADEPTQPAPPTPPLSGSGIVPDGSGLPASNFDQTSPADRIRSFVAPVAAKFGFTIKPGRGRPRLDGAPKKSDVVLPAPTSGLAAAPVVAVPARDLVADAFDSAPHVLFRRIVEKAARSEIALVKGLVGVKAEAADMDENFVRTALEKATPLDQSFKDVAESADYVAIKYGWKVDRMPELALGLDVLHLHAPFVTLFAALNAEIRRKRALEKPPAPAPAPAPPAKP